MTLNMTGLKMDELQHCVECFLSQFPVTQLSLSFMHTNR